MVGQAARTTITVTPHTTLDQTLDHLRSGRADDVVIALDPLSLLFASPGDFRALDTVRATHPARVTFAVNDPHRVGLALAFGYATRPYGSTEYRVLRTERPTRGDREQTAASPLPTAAGAVSETAFFPTARPDRPRDSTPHPAPSTSRSRWRWVRASLLTLCVVLLAAGGGGLWAVWEYHTATVTLTPAESSFTETIPVAIAVVPNTMADAHTLVAEPFTTTITRDTTVAATGKQKVPDGTATGSVTFRSKAESATTIKAGATLKGPGESAYLLQADVTVPGLDLVGGALGEATGKVRASVPGSAGNLQAGYALRFTDNLAVVFGLVAGGSEKDVTVVTDGDVATARADMERDIRVRALAEINTRLPAGTTAVNDYLTLGTPTVTAEPPAKATAVMTHVHLTMPAQIPVYRDAAFNDLVRAGLDEAVRARTVNTPLPQTLIAESVTSAPPDFVELKDGMVRYRASVSGKTRAIITPADLQRIQRALINYSDASARQTLAAEPAVRASEIAYGPSWLPEPLRRKIPRRAERVQVVVRG